MPSLPRLSSSLLVRTDFADDKSWQQVCAEAQAPSEDDGFRAAITPVSDPEFDAAPWEAVTAAVPANDEGAAVLFLADATTLTSSDHPILVVDLLGDVERPPFRCIPSELWSVENNLNIANMDWEEFSNAVDENGVFRGFTS